jgi:uncharacterized protein (DUF1697 family)
MAKTSRAHTYVALLRAINVGGHSVIKMIDLRARFEALGLGDVTSYIQSGNVVFTTRETDASVIARRIEQDLAKSVACVTKAFVLTPAELKKAAAHNPLEPARSAATHKCHLMFLSRAPDAAHRAALDAVQGDDYRLAVRANVLYLAYAKALAGKRRAINFEKVLGVQGTARSFEVVDALIALAASTPRV